MSSFQRGVQELARGRILSPVLRAELSAKKFKGFVVKVEDWTDRPWDGWFHPSTHAAWHARQLALYLTKPEMVEEEEVTFEKILAVTQGHFFHTFAGKVFQRHGIVSELEIPVQDPVHNRKGHVDGRCTNGNGYEFKTINEKYLLAKINDVESLRKYKPGYYAQAQDYIDMLGLDAMQYLIMGVWYPYPMEEFIVPRDDAFITAQRAKYIEAQEMAQAGILPDPCCLPRSAEAKTCPVARGCPIGRIR